MSEGVSYPDVGKMQVGRVGVMNRFKKLPPRHATNMLTYAVPDFTPQYKKKQLTSIRDQDTNDRLLEQGSEAEANPCTTETKIDDIRRVKKKKKRKCLHIDSIAPHPAQCSICPEPSVPPVGKEEP